MNDTNIKVQELIGRLERAKSLAKKRFDDGCPWQHPGDMLIALIDALDTLRPLFPGLRVEETEDLDIVVTTPEGWVLTVDRPVYEAAHALAVGGREVTASALLQRATGCPLNQAEETVRAILECPKI